MSQPCTRPLLALLLLLVAKLAGPAQAATVLSDETCEAPFVLSIPADVVRANRGLTLVLHDDGAGHGVLFDLRPDAVAVRLRRGAETTELASVKVALPAKGGAVVIKRLPDGFAVAYDAVTILRQKADLPNSGRWGVVDAPAKTLDELSLQPVDQVQFSDDFMRLPDQTTVWEDRSGTWRIAQLGSARYSANAFTLLGSGTAAQPALTAAGYWFWEDLTVEASVQPSPDATGFGLGLACQPEGTVYLLRFVAQAPPSGVLQLVHVQGGRETVLAEAPAVVSPDDWHRLALSGVGGRLAGALNGVELLTADVPGLAHGQIALWVAGPQPVAFDDIEAYSGPREVARPVVLSYEAQAADPGAQAFINDHYMQQWADERDQWLTGAGGLWHAGHYWGDVALTWEITAGALTDKTQLHLCVPAAADTLRPPTDVAAGCHLELARTADGQLALSLREGAQARADKQVPMPDLPATVTLRRAGNMIEALLGSEVVASTETTLPAAGKVGLTAAYARRQASRLSLTSRNVVDSTFRSAPTDWTIGSGEWGLSSRWSCTPRWSWFQGRSPDLASVWTRRRFPGDVVVEFFAGVSMDQPWAPFYRHPGNIAVTLCGSDGTPGSGYSLVFAGWGNSASGIFRRGELVAKVPGFVMPDILDSLGGTTGRDEAHKLHNEWQRLRAERIGGTVRLLVDGAVAASFDDPDPLPGGAVGIWTLEQAITVARARLYFQQAEDAPAPVAPPAALAAREALPLPRFGPPHVACTFEADAKGWRAAASGSCEARLAVSDAPGGGQCLQITNPTAGGSFALAAPFAAVDLRDHPLLAFDYAIPEDVHVDVFATVAGQRYRVILTGPDEPVGGIEDIGRVGEVRADGRWHEARVDLLGLLSPYFPGQAPVMLEALEFAAYAAPEYLRAGIGGNPAHARWRLDSVYLGGVTSGAVSLRAERGVQIEAPGCDVSQGVPMGGATHRLTPRQSGLTAVTLSSAGRTATDLIAFDTETPTLAAVEPQPGASWLGPRLVVAISDAGPAGIDERSLELTCAGKRFAFGDAALHWQAGEGRLVLDLRQADLRLAPGKPVEVVVSAADRAGNRAAPLQFVFTPQLAADTTAPDPPALTGAPPALLDCDFEADAGPITAWGADAGVALRRTRGGVAGGSRNGEWCLEARATKLGGLCGVSLVGTPFEASRTPVLEFDYRVPAELRVDLIVAVAGKRRTIKFTDNDQTWPVIGRIGATADGGWHHATVDLQGALGRAAPLVITDLAFASSGWPGNREGTCWWLDNVRLRAALNVKSLPEGLALQSRDESGLKGFAWVVDTAAATAPPAELSSQNLREALAKQPEGLAWLHAAAIDGAGNRSEAVAIPLRLGASDDTKPPVVSSPTPGDGEAACPHTLSAAVADEGAGVSPADLRLSINGRTWTVADEALVWDGAAGRLTWTLPAGVSLGANGARVNCRVDAADLAGNAAPPLEWTFTLDYSRDETPPAAPVVSYVPSRCADGNDFERGAGGWGNFLDTQILRQATGGATGPGCLELRHLGGYRHSGGFVLVRDFGEGWREFPMIRFRYRTVNAPGASLQILGTTFDGATENWTPLGTLPTDGGEWRTAEVDIAQALARANPALDIHRVFLSIALPYDGALLVDDYAMYSQAANRALFRWAEPASPSGITGYSWVLDAADDTVPLEKVRGTAREAEFTGLKPGRYVCHVRACNGAGHWGATSHVAVTLMAAPTAQ